ncbi:RidA family protein [Microbaculum marinum]|uniref:Rid family hydrolase n=1 Tax=Microbaculum marinum TaxID=1764581 RepID=A0AAW9RVK9_9HYPH
MKILSPKTVAAPGGPYVHGMIIDPGRTWLSVSGQVGTKPDGSVAEGIVEQTRTAWTNLTEILKEGGMEIRDIVKVTSFLTSADFIGDYGRTRAEFLGDFRPTSTLLVVAGLASPEFLVEVEVLAAR